MNYSFKQYIIFQAIYHCVCIQEMINLILLYDFDNVPPGFKKDSWKPLRIQQVLT